MLRKLAIVPMMLSWRHAGLVRLHWRLHERGRRRAEDQRLRTCHEVSAGRAQSSPLFEACPTSAASS